MTPEQTVGWLLFAIGLAILLCLMFERTNWRK